MRKDLSGIREWPKHTKNVAGGRRRINRANRLKAKIAIRKETDGRVV